MDYLLNNPFPKWIVSYIIHRQIGLFTWYTSCLDNNWVPIFPPKREGSNHWALYIWRKHANLSSVKQLKQKTWRISDELWRHLTQLTSFLWQRLKVVTASQAQYWARAVFTPPWIFWKIFFIFAVNFHTCQWEWFLWILFGLLRFIQRCTSYSRYPWPWKGMKN